MFEFINKEKNKIKHISGMIFEVLINPEDGIDYDSYNDTYQEFEFKKNHIVCKLINPEEFDPEPMPIGYKKIHAINRKAFKFYRAHNYIPEYLGPEGPRETERFLLQEGNFKNTWILTDKENKIVYSWEDQDFNDTQKIIELENLDQEQILNLPKILREAADWLHQNHRDKI